MNLGDAYQQIVTVLRDPEFARRLIQILTKERRVKEADKNRYHQSWNLNDLPAFGLINLDSEIIDRDRALYSTFEEFAVKKLPQPPLISADDLQEVALAQLGGITDETRVAQLQRFIYHVLLKVSPFHGGNADICCGDWTRAGIEIEEDYEDGPLWGDGPEEGPIQLANGFVLDVEIEERPIYNYKGYANGSVRIVCAKGFIRGICSVSAAKQLTEQMSPLVKSLLRSLKLAATLAELEPAIKESIPPLEDLDFDVN